METIKLSADNQLINGYVKTIRQRVDTEENSEYPKADRQVLVQKRHIVEFKSELAYDNTGDFLGGYIYLITDTVNIAHKARQFIVAVYSPDEVMEELKAGRSDSELKEEYCELHHISKTRAKNLGTRLEHLAVQEMLSDKAVKLISDEMEKDLDCFIKSMRCEEDAGKDAIVGKEDDL